MGGSRWVWVVFREPYEAWVLRWVIVRREANLVSSDLSPQVQQSFHCCSILTVGVLKPMQLRLKLS